jgi:hypothetical protein
MGRSLEMGEGKPVFDATPENMFSYEFQAKGPGEEIIASNSLRNLKKYIRENTRWRMAWVSCNTGCFSYGQSLVNEYPYAPRR